MTDSNGLETAAKGKYPVAKAPTRKNYGMGFYLCWNDVRTRTVILSDSMGFRFLPRILQYSKWK